MADLYGIAKAGAIFCMMFSGRSIYMQMKAGAFLFWCMLSLTAPLSSISVWARNVFFEEVLAIIVSAHLQMVTAMMAVAILL